MWSSNNIPLHSQHHLKSELRLYCEVCGEGINGYLSYGALTCSSCRVFFRRQINKVRPFHTPCHNVGNCFISPTTRTFCQACRFQKCLDVGMDPTRVKQCKKMKFHPELKEKQIYQQESHSQDLYDQKTQELISCAVDILDSQTVSKETETKLEQIEDVLKELNPIEL